MVGEVLAGEAIVEAGEQRFEPWLAGFDLRHIQAGIS